MHRVYVEHFKFPISFHIFTVHLYNPLCHPAPLSSARDSRDSRLPISAGSPNIKVATGGVGGSHYCCDHEFDTLEKAMQCDAINILSIHGYMSKASDWAYYITGDKDVLTAA
jgi:hypothetical protein